MSRTAPTKQILLSLAILDLVWSIIAIVFDWSAIIAVPPIALPFILICPLYPFLLALYWLLQYRGRTVNSYLLTLAALPTSTYAVLSLLFYPLIMTHQGFSFLDLGQIFWVWFYGIQGWYLLASTKIKTAPLLLIGAFVATSLVVQYRSLTYGYLGVDILTLPERQTVALLGLATVAVILLWSLPVNSLKPARR